MLPAGLSQFAILVSTAQLRPTTSEKLQPPPALDLAKPALIHLGYRRGLPLPGRPLGRLRHRRESAGAPSLLYLRSAAGRIGRGQARRTPDPVDIVDGLRRHLGS